LPEIKELDLIFIVFELLYLA